MEKKRITMELGHTLKEWEEKFMINNDECNWSFPINEFLDGTIEPDESITYWYINGRLFETNNTY